MYQVNALNNTGYYSHFTVDMFWHDSTIFREYILSLNPFIVNWITSSQFIINGFKLVMYSLEIALSCQNMSAVK
jgi:hypothetical protein